MEGFLQTASIFVDHHAEINRRWTFDTKLRAQNDDPYSRTRSCKMQMEISRLGLLQSCLSTQAGFADLERSCASKGAQFYVKWKNVELEVMNEKTCRYALSKHESMVLLGLWWRQQRRRVLRKEHKANDKDEIWKFWDDLEDGYCGFLTHVKIHSPVEYRPDYIEELEDTEHHQLTSQLRELQMDQLRGLRWELYRCMEDQKDWSQSLYENSLRSSSSSIDTYHYSSTDEED